MGDVLKTWIRTRLGAEVDLRPEIFGRYTSDGTLLAQILHSYDIINSSQLSTINHTQDPALSRVNLKHLRVWLRFIGITVDDDCIEDISCGKGTTALQLFYKVYLCLESKDRLHFITLQKEREKYIPTSTKFDVVTVNEDPPPYEPADHPLAETLIKGSETIEWHRGKFQAIVEACRRERERFQSVQPQIIEVVQEHLKPSAIDERKEEMTQTDEFARKHRVKKTAGGDKYDPCSPKPSTTDIRSPIEDPEAAEAYVKWLKQRRRKIATAYALKSRVQKMLLSELWEKLAETQDREIDESLARRVLDQSQYEKQMMTKLLDIRKQKNIIADNRKVVDDLMLKEKEHEQRFNEDRKRELALRESEDVDMECRRLCELQTRIREEKVRKMKERHYRICLEIVLDLADIAIQASDCRMANDGYVPLSLWNTWKALFVKNQPIFSLLDTGDSAECNVDQEKESDEIEEIIELECERHEVLNDADFENYLNLSSPWDKFVPPMDHDEEEILRLGRIVLGYIVHRLLEFVYPYPGTHTEAPIPRFNVAAVVHGILNPQLCEQLQTLLNNRNIRLIHVEDAINYCLSCYKEEMTDFEYIDLNIIAVQEETMKQIELAKHQVEGPRTKSASTSRSKKAQRSMTSLRHTKSTEDKATQTPRVIPYDDIDPVLSNSAYIGKWAYEFLSLGQPISNDLTAKIVVEYLRSLTDVDGWALMNYPENYEQMACLEFALTGQKVSPDPKPIEFKDVNIEDIDPMLPRIVYEDEEVDSFAIYRQSRLVPNPIFRAEVYNTTTTFITAFIRVIPKPKSLNIDERDLFEVLPEDATSMDTYFADLNVAYVVYYTQLNIATLKRIARLIIGDMSLPRKSSYELFGDALYDLEDDRDAVQARSKAPVVKQVMSLMRYGEMEGAGEADEGEDYLKTDIIEPPRPVKPGEEGWVWVDFPQPTIVLDALATLWENLEEVYIENIKETFYLKRTHAFSVLPYKEFITNNMADFIARPDTKQDLLHTFHTAYNEIDADMRDDDEVKCELHCRVADFQAELWEICDVRRKEAESERQRIVYDHWTYYEAVVLVNIYVGFVQTEIDRCIDTLQMVQDYYTSMMQKQLQEVKFAKILFERLQVEQERPSEDSTRESVEKQTTDKPSRSKDSRSKGVGASSPVAKDSLKQEIANLLIDAEKESFDPAETSVYKAILRVVQQAKTMVDSIAAAVNDTLKKEDLAMSPKTGKDKVVKKQSSQTLAGMLKLSERGRDLVLEWRYAALFEIYRVRQRLEILKAAALSDVDFLLNTIRRTFHQIYLDIVERYQRELKSVNDMATTFCFAIEEGVPIQQEMLLDGDQFIVRSNVLLFPHEHRPSALPVREAVHPSQFQISQLGRLMDVFKRIAPTGILPERALIYILQDMVSSGAEQSGTLPLPISWLQLNPCDITNLVDELFGPAVYVDWREFIIYAMDLPMPTYDEILNARDMFRVQDPELKEIITRDQYHATPLWFFECTETTPDVKYMLHEAFQRHSDIAVNEDDSFGHFNKINGIVIPKAYQKLKGRQRHSHNHTFSTETADLQPEEIVRLMLAKELLSQMYLTSKHTVNYTALLLALCKDEDPREGFAKMLSLVLGNPVCTKWEDGEKYVEELLEQKRIALEADLTRDKFREEAIQTAAYIIDTLLDTVERGFTITEVFDAADEIIESGRRRLTILELDDKGDVDREIDPSDLLVDNGEQLYTESLSSLMEEEAYGESITSSSSLYERIKSGTMGRPIVHWVPLNVCLAVLNAALPWHAAQDELFETSKCLRANIIAVYDDLFDEELSDSKDKVLSHRLLNHSFITELLASTSKFTTKHIGNIFNDIMQEKNKAAMSH